MIDGPSGIPHDLRNQPFTTRQALDVGLTHDQLSQAVLARWLRRPVRGVYVPASIPDTLESRCATLRLSVPDDAFICDHTASWLHAGDSALVPNDHLRVPEVSCFHARTGNRLRRAHIRSGERDVRPDEIMEVDGLRVTTPLRTAIDIGRLARNNDVRLHGMDCMLSLGSFSHAELLNEIPRFKGQRGVVGLRALAPLADGGAQSFGESALRLRWHAAHLPWPATQVPVPGPRGEDYAIDIGLPGTLLGAEYDGEAYHSSEAQRQHDADRRRWLLRQGWTVEPFRGEHVFGHHEIAERRLRAVHDALVAGRKSRTYFL